MVGNNRIQLTISVKLKIMKLKQPTKQIEEVLYYLIKRDSINVSMIHRKCGILNLTARISDIINKLGLNVICNKVHTTNKFGRSIRYGNWHIENKEKAIKLYNAL